MKGAILFAVVLTLYLAFPTRTLYWDGAGFAMAVDHPGWFTLIEPNHPVYIGFGWGVHALARMAAPAILGLTVLQSLNSVLGAIAVVIVYSIAARLFADQFDALLVGGLFALSGTWWKFATDADAYVPSILLLLMAARLLLPGDRVRPVVVALIHTGAMLFHELAVLFVIPAAVGLYAQAAGDRRPVIKYVALAFTLTSAAYFICFHIATGQSGLAEYLRWITWHTPDSSFSFGLVRNAWLTIRGTAGLAVGGKVSAFHSGPGELVAVLTLLGLGAWLAWRKADRRSSERPVGAFLWTWVAVYVGFLFFWLPQNTFYRLFYLAPLALLTGTALREWSGRRVLYAAVALVGTWNWLFYIHPDSLVETNTLVRAAFAMRPVWKPGTWVYLGSFNADNWTMFCFNPQVNFKNVDRTKLTETAQELQEFARTGHETWIDQSGVDLLESNAGSRQWLAEHTRPGFKRDFSGGKYRVSFDRLFRDSPH